MRLFWYNSILCKNVCSLSHSVTFLSIIAKGLGLLPMVRKMGKRPMRSFLCKFFELKSILYRIHFDITRNAFLFSKKNDLNRKGISILSWRTLLQPSIFCQKNRFLGKLPGLFEECGWRKSTKYKQVVPREIS